MAEGSKAKRIYADKGFASKANRQALKGMGYRDRRAFALLHLQKKGLYSSIKKIQAINLATTYSHTATGLHYHQRLRA